MTAAQWPLVACSDAEEATDRILCTEATETKQGERGDSGGPLLVKVTDEWVQVGLLYWLDPENGVTLHQDVTAYADWIASAASSDPTLQLDILNRTGVWCRIDMPGLTHMEKIEVHDYPDEVDVGKRRQATFVGSSFRIEIQCGDSESDGTGGSTTSVVAPPPPAPEPFQPQPVSVALGNSGDTVSLMTTEAGGFTLNGEEFKSGGIVTAENGSEYVLTLADSQWTASLEP